ncbi:MAG: methylated-DNA--[protein]-cysteine S-methyltransferase [Acidobacteria bacterium]|nr:methylated-DNA--[protein]-cysteine S-methyltransferase [Acidobacteriota bacterium]
MKLLTLTPVDSPVGRILLVSDGPAVVALDFEDYRERMSRLLARRYGECELEPGPHEAADRLKAYFARDFSAFDGLPVSTAGSGFQERVWSALREIPPGQAISYGELAARIGNPAASRAVGHANSLNPVAIIVPCHRVVGSNRRLTGYAGGLGRKEWLLAHEGAHESVAVQAALPGFDTAGVHK